MMKIAIDAGHGPDTPGKRTPDESMREYHFNAVVADKICDELSKYDGVAWFRTDHSHRDVPLRERTDRANQEKADVLISIHANAHGTGGWNAAEGIETFLYPNRSSTEASFSLAQNVQQQLIQLTGRKNRGVKHANFHMLRESRMTAILVECGFMTHRQEAELLKSDAYRQICAMAIVAGIVETYRLQRQPDIGKEQEQLATPQRALSVYVNEQEVGTGYLIDGLSYVPVRVIADAFGAKVHYDGQNVHILKGY
jgi:N-acetylmuramoyl-L-alanine amidase